MISPAPLYGVQLEGKFLAQGGCLLAERSPERAALILSLIPLAVVTPLPLETSVTATRSWADTWLAPHQAWLESKRSKAE